MSRPILLINTNITEPPVSPVGLEYVGEALTSSGVSVSLLDLSFESDWRAALKEVINNENPFAIGITIRNTDDSCYSSQKSFVTWILEVVDEIKRLSQSFIFIGGVGFSIIPEAILEYTKADAGIAGDGEEAAIVLVKRLLNGEDISDLPNLVCWRKGKVVTNKRNYADLRRLPLPKRRLIDNKRYEQMGAMVGIETKRGCDQSCIFCADPVAKGNRVRLRPPALVIQEFKDLCSQGVSWFHICDSEFNLPIEHAKELCRAIIDANLANKLNWYCYCAPTPFDQELASLMKRAGCCGINFGADSLCDEQLLRLGKDHSSNDVCRLVSFLEKEDLNYMFDLIIGAPGETELTVAETIEKAKELDIPLVGISAGIRVYSGTPLGKAIANGFGRNGMHPEGWHNRLIDPIYYLSPYLNNDVSALIHKLVAGDTRFLFLASPSDQDSYNYADSGVLSQLIQEGARGAYWDIIRRNRK